MVGAECAADRSWRPIRCKDQPPQAFARLRCDQQEKMVQRSIAETGRLPVSEMAAGAVEGVPVRALLLGERLDTRALERGNPLAIAPLAVEVPGGGLAVLFRYGAIVLFGTATAAIDDFVASLRPSIAGRFPAPERDEARLLVRPESDQQVDASGNIVLRERTTERLQLVADILAKSLVLSHYETRIADIFDGIEPLAATLREKGRAGASGKELLRHIGDVLLMQQKMVGRVETGEKPELLWEHPELERFYLRLAEEYELRDRDRALDRKLDIISRTVETLLSLVQTRSSMRVEWYIVLLIIAELLLTTYPLLLHR
jgi:required for meiotic nuclear division protein 1